MIKYSVKEISKFAKQQEKYNKECYIRFRQFLEDLDPDTPKSEIDKYWNMYHAWNYINDLNVDNSKDSWDKNAQD